MNTSRARLNPRVIRTGLVTIAVALLVGGGVWRGIVAEGRAVTSPRAASPVTAPPRDVPLPPDGSAIAATCVPNDRRRGAQRFTR